jgi:hypothetical protein
MALNNEPTDEEFFHAIKSPEPPKEGTPNESFTVYNPVEDSFEGWPHGTYEDDSFHDNSNSPGSPSRNIVTTDESPDDELARQIAEQDLPPGVSAIEQQEIMMRLLTQQLRRGEDARGEISPELEQRLRE